MGRNSIGGKEDEWQSMSERRKVLETEREQTPVTPTKVRIPSLTPVQIPGVSTPRKIRPSAPWTMLTPTNNVARPNGTPSSQPLKGILKTPERSQYSGSRSPGNHSKSNKKRFLPRTPKISFAGDTKRGHGSY